MVANFEKNRFTVAVLSNNISIGTVTGNGTYGCDTIATVIATPTSCYNFTKWTENGSTVSTNANYSFTVNNNRTLTAIFEPKRFNIALLANPTNGGTALGAGNFPCNSVLTVKAKIKTGYEFINWTEGSTIVSTDSNYTFLVSKDRNLKANFRLTTGIKQTTINEISKVYPNPANDVLLVEIRSKQNTSLTLNIIDMKGSLIESKTISNSKGTTETLFDVRKLSKGNYIINLYDEEGMASYKFVVH
ncbi:MAG: T9SS type A sorting domain-containing protein [Bacteroidetes bacterium]|nr:T9SS type A sorting domain-containing protein [Bacteroidota bacterium]